MENRKCQAQPELHVGAAVASTPRYPVARYATSDVPCKNGREDVNRLNTYLECPVCYELITPPVLQCALGHLVCSDCFKKVSICPMCRTNMGRPIRNLLAEKFASEFTFPCRFAPFGCNEELPYNAKNEHEDSCPSRSYPCPSPGSSCLWSGTADKVLSHILCCHRSVTKMTGADVVLLATNVDIPGPANWVMMQEAHGAYFLIYLNKKDLSLKGNRELISTSFYVFIQIIGSKDSAKRFRCTLEVGNVDRRMAYSCFPHSLLDNVTDAANRGECMMFDVKIARSFASDNGLAINSRISLLEK